MKILWNKVTWYSKSVAVVVFLVVFGLGIYVWTQVPPTVLLPEVPVNVYSSVQDECNLDTPQEVEVCSIKLYAKVDSELQKYYNRMLKLASHQPEYKTRLMVWQKIWGTFRDAECDVKLFWKEGGSAWTAEYRLCLTDLTRQRLKDLQKEPILSN